MSDETSETRPKPGQLGYEALLRVLNRRDDGYHYRYPDPADDPLDERDETSTSEDETRAETRTRD